MKRILAVMSLVALAACGASMRLIAKSIERRKAASRALSMAQPLSSPTALTGCSLHVRPAWTGSKPLEFRFPGSAA